MRARLKTLLHQYLQENNPDILLLLETDQRLTAYLEAKVEGVSGEDEESCMEQLTRDLRPSKFHFIKSLLEEEFENDYYKLLNAGILAYEIINLIESCQPVFDVLPLTEDNEDNNQLRYAIAGSIAEYLEAQTADKN